MNKIILILLLLFNFAFSNTLYDLLKAKDYNKLDAYLQKASIDALKNSDLEKKFYNLFYDFKYNKNSKKLIEDYLKNKPKSEFAHMLLGEYYLDAGYKARGNKWTKDTPKENIKKMSKLLQKANSQFLKAIELNNLVAFPYTELMSTYAYMGYSRDNLFYQASLELPNSLKIYTRYLWLNLTRWGGSYENIEYTLKEMKKRYKFNPEFKKYEGFVDYAKADYNYYHSHNYKKALQFINKAIKVSNNTIYKELKANILFYLKEYQKSLELVNLLLKEDSKNEDMQKLKLKLLYRLKKYDLAYKLAEDILQKDKSNFDAYYIKGLIDYAKSNYDMAILNLLSAYGLDKTKSVNVYLGFSYYMKKEYNQAAMHLKEAYKLGANSSEVLYYLAASQWHIRDCDFVKSAFNYKKVCTKKGDCQKSWLDWAIKSANFAIKRGICKLD